MMRVVGLVAACVSGCMPGPGDQTIHGTAVLIEKDGEPTRFDNSAIVVCGFCIADAPCDCTGTNGAPVAADGSYTLDRGARGPNNFSARAPSTLEGTVTFTVDGEAMSTRRPSH